MTKLCFYKVIVLLAANGVASAQNISKLKMADVLQRINQPNDTTYIISFWATFCKPCVAEIPGFIKVADKYKNEKVKLLLVSLDLPGFYPKRIAAFATKNNFNTNIAWLNETNADYFCPLIDSSWSGAIPATVIVNAKRGYKKFWEGEVSEAELEGELKKVFGLEKLSVDVPKFINPMNEVILINYYDRVSHPLDETPYDNVNFKAKDSAVFSVNEGEVVSIVDVEDFKVVIVKRRNLFYTYSNLKTVLVKKSELITADQMIGFACKDLDDGLFSVDFLLNSSNKNISLTKSNFMARDKKSQTYRFSPMLWLEPE